MNQNQNHAVETILLIMNKNTEESAEALVHYKIDCV